MPPQSYKICISLYVKSKEGKRRGIIGLGKKTPAVESGGLFEEETFATVEKSRF